MTGRPLTAADLEAFAAFGVAPKILADAGFFRVTDAEARSIFGFNGTGDNAGIIIPNLSPLNGQPRTYVLRRDHPPVVDGKLNGKYLHSHHDPSYFYFPPGCGELLPDVTVPVIVVEAEKSAIALWAWAWRVHRPILPIGTNGCWGWRGKIGKAETPDGKGTDERGPVADFGLVTWTDREVIILFDSNVDANPQVRAGRRALTELLTALGAKVKWASIPATVNANGPDDLLRECNDQILAEIIDNAVPSPDAAHAEAVAAVAAIEEKITPVESLDLAELKKALAVVEDKEERSLLIARAASALRGTLAKSDLQRQVDARRAFLLAERKRIAEDARVAALKKIEVNPAKLARALESFFAERAYLPQGAALVLAFFVMNTWVFELFDAVPYMCVESPTPECGKTTLLRLIEAVCCVGRRASSLT